MENALPVCQLKRLRDCCAYLHKIHLGNAGTDSKAHNPTYLWIDTLCVPVHPSAKPYRKRAIQLLGKTFHEASTVLVLDRELEYVESTTSSFLELGIRILCSGWMKRLWTLQEAMLGSEAYGTDKIYFQMRDGPFQYQRFDRSRRLGRGLNKMTTEVQAEERSLLMEDWIMVQLGEAIPSINRLRKVRPGWPPLFILHPALKRRLTSKIEDFPLCVASLLEKDIAPILSVTTLQEKMAQLYLVMRDIPIGVLWAESAEKISMPPFRWAPLSLTDCSRSNYFKWPLGVCEETGFRFQHQGMILRLEDIDVERDMSSDEPTAQFPNLFAVLVYEDEQEYSCMYLRSHTKTISIPRHAALIVPRRQQLLFEVLLLAIESTDTDIEGETESVCTILGYFVLLERVVETSVTLRADLTSSTHRWCIT